MVANVNFVEIIQIGHINLVATFAILAIKDIINKKV